MGKQINKGFFTEFLKQGNNIGAVAPSSKHLVSKMLDPIDFSNVKCIVEFGPGTGSITTELLNKMPDNSLLLVFEINKEFCDLLCEIKDKRMVIITDSAENLDLYLQKYAIEKVDYIISSLPLFIIPNTVVENVLMKVKKYLKPKGSFIQYQYSLNAYRKLKNLFKKVDLDFAMINLPPAFIFNCTN